MRRGIGIVELVHPGTPVDRELAEYNQHCIGGSALVGECFCIFRAVHTAGTHLWEMDRSLHPLSCCFGHGDALKAVCLALTCSWHAGRPKMANQFILAKRNAFSAALYGDQLRGYGHGQPNAPLTTPVVWRPWWEIYFQSFRVP